MNNAYTLIIFNFYTRVYILLGDATPISSEISQINFKTRSSRKQAMQKKQTMVTKD